MSGSYLLVAAALGVSVVVNAVVLGAFLDASSDSKRSKGELRSADARLAVARRELHKARLHQCPSPVGYTPPTFPIPDLELRQSRLTTPAALRGEVSGA